ncbi:hypothetical protein WJX74_010669 [Apatococcus lobatus]|uniref:Uncharacterized protein n=1 Tax=Apatococcus lobatus TaxID=904363 RepID=A0AAW1RP94_9CHLO
MTSTMTCPWYVAPGRGTGLGARSLAKLLGCNQLEILSPIAVLFEELLLKAYCCLTASAARQPNCFYASRVVAALGRSSMQRL